MRATITVLLVALCAGVIALAASDGPAPKYDPTSAYELRQIEGWPVYINKKLLAHEELSEAVLRELACQLYQVKRRVPAKAVVATKQVKIWVELKGKGRGASYHPSRQWLVDNDRNPDKAQSVEISNAHNFLAWTKHQPYMVLHELSHAYHHQVLGWDNPRVIQAYRKAKASGSYDKILNWRGVEKVHYAMNNQKEYFAEASEAYFGTNDMYPFVNAELKRHDPLMHKLLGDLWGVE